MALQSATRLITTFRPSAQVLKIAPRVFGRPLSTTRPLRASGPILLENKEDGFGFIRHNARPPKPRKLGVTEIRGPYYSAMGKRYLQDVLETYGGFEPLEVRI